MMQRYTRVLPPFVGALLVIVLMTASAPASRAIAVSPSGTVRATTLAMTFGQSPLQIICNVTLEGSIARSISKAVGASAGRITAASAANCRARIEARGGGEPLALYTGEARLDLRLNLPWSINYRSFLGTLPNMTGIGFALEGYGFLIGIGNLLGEVRCLFTGTIDLLGTVAEGRWTRLGITAPALTQLFLDLSRLFPFSCPRTMVQSGSMTLSPTQTVTLT